jgi:hypothetical protein
MTLQGPQPSAPADLNAALIANVKALVPDYTATLPGSLIEDISSTDTAALYQMDQNRIDLINSITPYGANLFILSQMAILAGIPQQGQPDKTSVYVVLSGTLGYTINPGFTVSDGTYRYTVQAGAIVGTGGKTAPVFCVAELSGSWPVPIGSVSIINNSVPSGITLTVTNPTAGTPGGGVESDADFRARCMQAYMVTGQGCISYLKSNLLAINGVQPRLVSIKATGSGYEIICGGGDPYQIAYAIFRAMFWLPGILGSGITARNITVSVYDYPDLYNIVFVNPPQQTVTVTVKWQSIKTGFIDPSAVAQLINPAVVSYINQIGVGQPINLLDLDTVIQVAISTLIPMELLSNLVYVFTINSVTANPIAGTRLIASDSESYFYITNAGVTVVAG